MYSKPDVQNWKSLRYIFGHYRVGNVLFLNMMVHFSVCPSLAIMVVKGG